VREVAIVLPIALARAMWDRAERFDVDRGGRFDRRAAAVLVWSAPLGETGDGEPVGGAYVRWHTPDDGHATIWRLEWDATAGSEAEVRRALAVLAGGALGAP
jgi:hypothetical protein